MTANPIPVTIITGFLGSGKTTLLNRVLTHPDSTRIAVIQNEFGEIGIDHELTVREDEGIFEMQNGCLCCTVRDDLIRILESLRNRKAEFDRILIETTGLADPIPVAQTFFSSIHIQKDFQLDGIITVVDARHVVLQLEQTPETRNQIVCADLIILNKIDLVDLETQQDVMSKVKEINEDATIISTSHSDVPLEKLFNISLLHPEKIKDVEASFESAEGNGHSHTHERHDNHIHPHEHDDDVTSLSLEFDGFMDLERLDAWLNMLTMLQGNSLYRMKGILNLPDDHRKFVFQSVFAVLQGDFGKAWKPDEKRRNRFVFIGKNLNKALLTDGFKACLMTESSE
jgi:G3E family GTPase